MTNILCDVRFGVRLLRRNPGFAAVAILALALGIGATTAIFSVVYATLLAPLPYPQPDQLVMVWSRVQGNRNVSAAGTYLEWKRQSTAFQSLNAWTGGSLNLATSDRPEQVSAAMTTPGFLSMTGTPMALGRDFRAEEGQVGRDQVVILTNQIWQERFGGDRAILGRQIRIDAKPYIVVGILAPGQADRMQPRLYVPLAFRPEQVNHDFHWLLVMGRLKPDVSLAQANANMEAVSRRLAEAFPASNKGWSSSVEPLKNNFLSQQTQTALWLLLGAVAFVLLIACANVANLLLARGTARQRELAVRASMGAPGSRLFRQMLTESVTLAIIGGVLGVALASVMLDGIMALMPPFTLPSEADVRLNVPVLLFSLAACGLSGILFGCAPAWQAARANVNEMLKETGRSLSGGRHRLRRALVVVEFALALSLLAGGGLAIHSLMKLADVNIGFQTERLLTFDLPVPIGRLTTPEQIVGFYDRVLERVREVPGIVSASHSVGMPVAGPNFGMPFTIVGDKPVDRGARQGAGFAMVSPEYFRTFGIQIIKGRAFTAEDREGALRVAIVNERFVNRYLNGRDPLKHRLAIEQLIPGVTRLGPTVEWQIVGVARHVRNAGPKDVDGFPEIDVPFLQSPWPGASIALRTAGEPTALQQSIAAVVRSIDPDLPMANVRTMDQIIDQTMASDRFNTALFGAFAVVALILAAFGIYGVMSFVVVQRTHEIGLRMALGAGRTRVVKDVILEGMITALVGVVIGSAGAYGVGRAMQGMWYDVGAMDPAAFTVVAVTLLASALLACFIPAQRAASVDPMSALRQE
jgi:putative ABC transport system permease protein